MSKHQPFGVVDAGVIVLVAGTVASVLPPIAAALGIAWYSVMLWESKTGRWWRNLWRRLWGKIRGR